MPHYASIAFRILVRYQEQHTMKPTDRDSARAADERLRNAARKALGRGDFGDLLLVLLQPPGQAPSQSKATPHGPEDSMLMRAIRGRMLSVGLATHKAEIEADNVALTFLENKVRSEAFLRQLAEAGSPWGLLRRAAINAAVDHLRTLVRIYELDREVVEEVDADATEQASPQPPGIDDDLVREEARDALAAKMAEAHAAMSLDDSLLLEVLHVEAVPMSAEHAKLLAEQRKIPLEKLEAELDARRTRRDEETAAESRLRGLEVRLNRLRDRTRWAEALIRECRDDGPAKPANRTTEQLHRLAASASAFRSATPAERTALLQRLQQRTAAMVKTIEKVGKRSERGHLAEWREVARLLGEVPDDPTEEQLKLAANRLVTRWRRLRAKLQTLKKEDQQ
jgi:hypothetical protein